MKNFIYLFISAFLLLQHSYAQKANISENVDFNLPKLLAPNSLKSVVLNTKFPTSQTMVLDSPNKMQIIFLDPGQEGSMNNREYYLKQAQAEQRKGVIFAALGGGMMALGAGLITYGVIRGKGVNGNGNFIPLDNPEVPALITTGSVFAGVGLGFLIKGLVSFSDASYFRKKASKASTSYEIEPTILRASTGGNAFGLSARLKF